MSHISLEPLASATNLEYVQRNHWSKESKSSRRQADLEVCVCRNLPLLVWPMFFHRFRVNMKSIARLKSIVSPPRRRSNYPRSFGTGSETKRAWPSCLKMLKVLKLKYTANSCEPCRMALLHGNKCQLLWRVRVAWCDLSLRAAQGT